MVNPICIYNAEHLEMSFLHWNIKGVGSICFCLTWQDTLLPHSSCSIVHSVSSPGLVARSLRANAACFWKHHGCTKSKVQHQPGWGLWYRDRSPVPLSRPPGSGLEGMEWDSHSPSSHCAWGHLVQNMKELVSWGENLHWMERRGREWWGIAKVDKVGFESHVELFLAGCVACIWSA